MTDVAKTELERKREELEATANTENAKRSGKGTRIKVGSTRGKNPQAVSYENFDLSQPDTLPKTLSEFMDLTKIQDEPTILSFLVDGYNDAMYSQASDPVAEYINPEWPEDVQRQFRIVVRNYATGANVSIEDAVALIKPGIEASQKKPATV